MVTSFLLVLKRFDADLVSRLCFRWFHFRMFVLYQMAAAITTCSCWRFCLLLAGVLPAVKIRLWGITVARHKVSSERPALLRVIVCLVVSYMEDDSVWNGSM